MSVAKQTRKDSMSQILKNLDALSLHKATRSLVRVSKVTHVHQMLGVLIVVAHASEITRVTSHISLWHLAIAIILFGLWLAGEKHSSEELA